MRGAVAELSGVLVELFEMVRTDRAEQRVRIDELQAQLVTAHLRLAELEARGASGSPAVAAADPTDFDQLRLAAERLRQRTAELMQQTPTPAEVAEAQAEVEAEVAAAPSPTPEPFGKPGILRVFPGAFAPAEAAREIDVESDLEWEDEEPLRRVAVQPAPVAPAPVAPAPVEPAAPDAASSEQTTADAASETEPAAAQPAAGSGAPRVAAAEPIELGPRPARKRHAGLRRRRIDARKLAGVDPAAALRAMVSAIDEVWTAGCRIDLVVALTDGGAMHVSGGDTAPLQVVDVEHGTSARTTVTATTAQVVPLFGRLDLTDAQSAPLIHGERRDADLLVGWIDRAQRLAAEPL